MDFKKKLIVALSVTSILAQYQLFSSAATNALITKTTSKDSSTNSVINSANTNNINLQNIQKLLLDIQSNVKFALEDSALKKPGTNGINTNLQNIQKDLNEITSQNFLLASMSAKTSSTNASLGSTLSNALSNTVNTAQPALTLQSILSSIKQEIEKGLLFSIPQDTLKSLENIANTIDNWNNNTNLITSNSVNTVLQQIAILQKPEQKTIYNYAVYSKKLMPCLNNIINFFSAMVSQRLVNIDQTALDVNKFIATQVPCCNGPGTKIENGECNPTIGEKYNPNVKNCSYGVPLWSTYNPCCPGRTRIKDGKCDPVIGKSYQKEISYCQS